ncbi:MAG TPA: redoxin domain-containing protein [Pseudogracilibacillus sp.]|nr:redoxin domain-containing protein [Pseudogracilibacillus sp.]
MKRWIIAVIIVGLVGWAVYDFVLSGGSTKVGLKKGNIAPDFELELMDGEVVKLSDYKGEKVLLNFWATWCPPCRAEMPDMQKFHEESEDGVILAVNFGETKHQMEQVEEFLDEFDVTFDVLKDEENDVSSIYEVAALPTSYFIDEEGRIHDVVKGGINYDSIVKQFDSMN